MHLDDDFLYYCIGKMNSIVLLARIPPDLKKEEACYFGGIVF
jgi:hypothetical protein